MSGVVRRRLGLGPLITYGREIRTELKRNGLGNGRITRMKDEDQFKYRIRWDTIDSNPRIEIVLHVIRELLSTYAPGWYWASREEEMPTTMNVWKRETRWKYRHCMSVVISR